MHGHEHGAQADELVVVSLGDLFTLVLVALAELFLPVLVDAADVERAGATDLLELLEGDVLEALRTVFSNQHGHLLDLELASVPEMALDVRGLLPMWGLVLAVC